MPVDFAALTIGCFVRVTHVSPHSRNERFEVGNIHEVVGWTSPSGETFGNISRSADKPIKHSLVSVRIGPEEKHSKRGWWNVRFASCEIVAPTRSPDGDRAILKRMSELTNFHDVTVIVDGCEMSAPGIVLAAASPVLNAMLSTAMQEGTSKTITLGDVSSCAARVWLSYISTGELHAEDSLLVDIANLSDMYEMPELLGIVAEQMCKNVQPDTAGIFLRTLRTLPQSKGTALAYKRLSERVRGDASLFEGMMNDGGVQRGTKRKAKPRRTSGKASVSGERVEKQKFVR